MVMVRCGGIKGLLTSHAGLGQIISRGSEHKLPGRCGAANIHPGSIQYVHGN